MPQPKNPSPSPSSSGKHVKPRTGVQVPEEWHAIARKLAATEEKPVLWLLIKLIREHALETGIAEDTLPRVPWALE